MRINFKILLFILSNVIGSGIFLIPLNLKDIGSSSFISLTFISVFFGYITVLFTKLPNNVSLIGFIKETFGNKIGFFVSWMYWFISCSSTIIIVTEMFRYIIKMLQILDCNNTSLLLLENQSIFQVLIVGIFTLFNLKKTAIQNKIEFILNILKLTPLIILPIFAFFSYNFNLNLVTSNPVSLMNCLNGIPKFIWCFFGIECGMFIQNKKDITKTTIISIALIFIIYFLNLLAVFGVLGFKIMSFTPFADFLQVILGNIGGLILSILIIIVAAGSLNSWLISGMLIAIEHENLGYFPKISKSENDHNSYYLMISSAILIPLCFLSTNHILMDGLNMAGNGILLFYMIFCIAYFLKNKNLGSIISAGIFLGIFCFCANIFDYFNNIY